MKYIKKTKEPDDFTRWKSESQFNAEVKINDESISTSDLWKRFTKTIVCGNLRKFLIKEQFGLCCYCGQKLKLTRQTNGENDFDSNELEVSIEHLKDKQSNRDDIFNYYNLLASCSGVITRKRIRITCKSGENKEEAIKLQLGTNAKYKIESENSDHVIVKLLITQCNNKKDNKEIKVTPLQDDCEEKFHYDPLDGKIIGIDKEAEETTMILGLGDANFENPYLEEKRLNAINEAYIALIQKTSSMSNSAIGEVANAPFAFWKNLDKDNIFNNKLQQIAKELYEDELKPEDGNNINPFPFVRRYVYKTEGSI